MHARNVLGRLQVAVVPVVGSPAQKVEEGEGGAECRPEPDRVSPVMPSVTITEMKEEEEKEGGGELDEVTSEPCSRCVCLGILYNLCLAVSYKADKGYVLSYTPGRRIINNGWCFT